MEIRYQIFYFDIFGVKKSYMNGASFESEDIVKHEIELLEVNNIKFGKGRSNFSFKPVEIKTKQKLTAKDIISKEEEEDEK